MTPPAESVLVVDDEPVIRATLAEFLRGEGFAAEAAASGEAAVARAQATRFDVVLCDVAMPGMDGLEVLEALSKRCPETFVILVTAYATVETAVEAFQRGAHDYLMKPVILQDLLTKIRRLLKTRDLFRENQWLRRELARDDGPGEAVVGRSPAMRAVYALRPPRRADAFDGTDPRRERHG